MSSQKHSRDKERRKQERKQLGKLRDLTVQPKTKERYNEGKSSLLFFGTKVSNYLPKGMRWTALCPTT